jgi:hypothetical protein
MMEPRRVFVVGGYIPNGGTFMAYHVARILCLDFGFQGISVGEGRVENGIFEYDLFFPNVSIEEMERSISDNDILIANPSFSSCYFGFKCRGRKVMYIQGFTTFQLLDCRFDLYVTVGDFVRNFILNVYGIDTTVVPPFIHADAVPSSPSWQERPPASILVSLKGDSDHQRLLLNHLQKLLADRLPGVLLDNVLNAPIPHQEFMSQIGQNRHFLTLSPAEGFGLMPLEAMAMGTTVLGFDGFGGRDYMFPGINCEVTAYPNVERIADQIVSLFANPERAESLARAGLATARQSIYTYDHFRTAWRKQFSYFLETAR